MVERIEVVTERRRLVMIAESKIAAGDHLFSHGTLRATEAMRPWRGRVSVIARLRFPQQNAYVMAPPVDVAIPNVPRLDLKAETLFGLSGFGLSAGDSSPLPVTGASAEAAFLTSVIGQTRRVVVVTMEGRELARVAIDFSRID
jgi:hypothetical protein